MMKWERECREEESALITGTKERRRLTERREEDNRS